MKMEHYLIRATIIPTIIGYIQNTYGMTEDEAMQAFYTSATAEALADDETGLYGQSALYIFGLFREEREGFSAV